MFFMPMTPLFMSRIFTFPRICLLMNFEMALSKEHERINFAAQI